MNLHKFIVALTGALLMVTGCEDKKGQIVDPTEDLILLGSQSDSRLKIEMYTDDSLKVGLNTFYFQLIDETTETKITEAHITQSPVMHMESHKHACPYTDPDMMANADDLFECEVVFIMASGMMGSWGDTVSVHNFDANTIHTVVFDDLTVLETNMKKNLVTYDADSNQVIYTITLNGLEDPEVGSNKFILTVHKKKSMMGFPEVTGMDISVNPQMPDMGHGSDGNINPIYTENGKYEGTVVFSMTGYWTIDFSFTLNGENLGTVQYEVNL